MTAENQNVTSNMDDEETVKAPVGLIILVVVLGIAIVGMLGLMAYKIMSGDASKPKNTEIPVAASEVRVAADMELGDMTITKPADSKLSKIETNANSIILHYQSDAKVTLIVIDRVTGKESHIVAPGMIVSIPKELLKKLERIAQETVPYEACGLLLGDNASEFIVRDCVVTDNVTAGNKKRSFEIDPGMHLKFQREARDSGLKVIGVWHSHPNGVAELSETDKKQSMEPSWLWLVTAVSGGMSETAAFVASKTDSHAFSSVGIIVSP